MYCCIEINKYLCLENIEMKNKETGMPYSHQEIDMIKRNSFGLLAGDVEGYINKKFRMPWYEYEPLLIYANKIEWTLHLGEFFWISL